MAAVEIIDPIDALLSVMDREDLDILYEAAVVRMFHYQADAPLALKLTRQIKQVANMYGEAFREWLTPGIAQQIAINGIRSIATEAREKVFPLTGAVSRAQQEMETLLKPAIETTYTKIGKLFPYDPSQKIQKAGNAGIKMRAEKLAKKRAGEMISDITDADRNRIKKIVADGIAKEKPAADIANDIMSWVKSDQMTPERALTIARTETATALGTAAQDAFTENGSKWKRWITVPSGKVCEICRNNTQMGKIRIEESFISGDMATPAHPNCRCVIWYDVPKEKGAAAAAKPKAKAGKKK